MTVINKEKSLLKNEEHIEDRIQPCHKNTSAAKG